MRLTRAFRFVPVFMILLAAGTPNSRAGDINSDLIAAVKAGNKKEVARIVKLGNLYVSKNRSGKEALLFCAKNGDLGPIKILLKSGCNINTRDKGKQKGWTALMYAIQNRHIEIAKFLIQKGAKLSLTPKKGEYAGWHPIQLAIEKGELGIVELLLNKGAKVDIREKKKRMTPLMIAADTGNVELTKLLLKKGADVTLRDKKGWTPLIHAVESASFPCIKELVKAGADVNAKDKDYISVLQHASARVTCFRKEKNAPEGLEKIVPFLKKHGAVMLPED
ncbi:MAG: ankyrin repeat domain-containing protein [Acidobacteria bacterium]|nr:ankyrin repeat domain-containing protein [Acidobacteriota bacterium]